LLALFGKETPLAHGATVLLLAPGPNARILLSQFAERNNPVQWTVLDSSVDRLNKLRPVLPARRALGQAARLPFKRHSFQAVVSIESLFAIRPPWTVLAEFHRVLVPDGKLILIEPQSLGFFSSLRDKISGPGKRVFPLDEIKSRLARADYFIDSVETHEKLSGFSRPAYCIRAIKKENPAEPVPQFLTAKEMMERRKKTHPAGEELP
jgi:SAM-dependent methyltransferase